MVEIGRRLGRKTTALITDMNEPLGLSIGNSLEVREAIMTLKGEGPNRLTEACVTLGSHMLMMNGIVTSLDEARTLMRDNIKNGKGLNKLKEIIIAQKGNPNVINDTNLLPISKNIVKYRANKTGYITTMNAADIGKGALYLGAGREKKGDKIDPSVGIVINKRINDRVFQGETIAYIYANGDKGLKETHGLLNSAITIKETPLEVTKPLIYKIIS